MSAQSPDLSAGFGSLMCESRRFELLWFVIGTAFGCSLTGTGSGCVAVAVPSGCEDAPQPMLSLFVLKNKSYFWIDFGTAAAAAVVKFIKSLG